LVVAIVEHDEAGVHVEGLIRGVDADRVGVAAGVGGRIVDHDLVLALQEMGGHETGDAGADDRNPHFPAPSR